MKKIIGVLWLLVGLCGSTYASHILGAEITYKHVSDYKYNAFVTVYRDCNECKIAGAGGGSNTKNCDSIFLYLKTSDRGTCTSTNLRTMTLTRENIVEILPLCQSASSKCQSDTGISYGVEAHTFSVQIDFENYKSYQSCGFEMYVQLSSRADDIDNLSQSTPEERLYNYSFINPFEIHDSPSFTANPQLILPINVPVRTYVSQLNTTDSVVVEFAQPLREAHETINYRSGYTVNRPITVWCNGDASCTPNAFANLPVGMTLNKKSGYLAFTPIKNSEKATIVIQVNTFRNTETGTKLISTIRRDILVETSSIGSHNNAPRLQGTSLGTDNDLEVCLGEELCFDITAEDKAYKFPDGSFQKSNSVSYTYETNIVGATITEVSQSNAPYNKLSFCWKPKVTDAGNVFTLRVTATDNNCPLTSSITQDYTIFVKDLPENNVFVNDLWCGNLSLVGDSTYSNTLHEVDWKIVNQSNQIRYHSIGLSDTVFLDEQIDGQLIAVMRSKLGCKDSFITPIKRTRLDFVESFTTVQGKTNYCLGDTIHLEANGYTNTSVDSIYWQLNGSRFKTEKSFSGASDQLHGANSIGAFVFGKRFGLQCRDTHTVDIVVEQGPEITFNNIEFLCASEKQLDLSTITNSQDGNWKALEHDMLSDDKLQFSSLSDITTSEYLCQEFSSSSLSSGCVSKDTYCLWVHPNPSFDLTKTTVCGATGYFNLTNMDSRLFSFGDYDITWLIDGNPLNHNELNKPHLVELTGLQIRDYQIIGEYTNDFGCSTRDTGVLSLLDNIDLSQISDKNICQDDVRSLTDIFSIPIIGGSWNSTSDFEDVYNSQFRNPDSCGIIGLNYTYDQFGCYVSKDLTLTVVCKPVIEFDIVDSVCQFDDFYTLSANPDIGNFTGDFVTGSQIDLTQANGNVSFDYIVNKDFCNFTYPQNLKIFERPQYSVFNQLPASICEGEELKLEQINVSNGWLKITGPDSATEIFTKKKRWVYQPSANDITNRSLEVTLELQGIGYCPIEIEKYKITINPLAKIELLESYYEGCVPFTFEPNFKAIPVEGIMWKDVMVNWNYGDGSKPVNKLKPSHNYKDAGNYSVSFTTETNEGCMNTFTWENLVKAHESPIALFNTLPSDQVSIREPIVSFVNKTPNRDNVRFFWDFGTNNPQDTSSEMSPTFSFESDTGVYPVSLKVVNQYSCEDIFIRNIYVGPDIKLYIPSAFSPNNKGSEITEEFKVIGNNVSSFHIEIFNRWGQQVYKSDDISEEWDGKSGNKFCEIGIYAYMIQATSLSGASYEFSGTINILR